MEEDKVRAILTGHREQMHQMVFESLGKGWKTWSTQAAELQLADHENRKKARVRMLQNELKQASITTIRDELANDIYELIVHHIEEINKMLDEFEDPQIAMAARCIRGETSSTRA